MALRFDPDPKEVAKFVIVESPFAGDIERNLRYVRACMRDCILKGEAPFASHALYTQPGVLNDDVPEEREIGMNLGWHVMRHAKKSFIYTDLGWSSGMVRGFNAAMDQGVDVAIRRLGGEWSQFEPGVNYARSCGREVVPPDAHNLQVINANDLTDTTSAYIEVDIVRGYGVRYVRTDKVPHVEVVKSNFRFGTYKE